MQKISTSILRFNNLDYTIIACVGDLSFSETGQVFKHCSDGTIALYKEPKFVISHAEVRRIDFYPDGIWRDHFGTGYGIRETDAFEDPDARCGVGFFSLPKGDPRNSGCVPHDYKYQSPLYKMYHTQKEADDDLKRDLQSVGAGKEVSNIFYSIVRQLGFWFYK